MSRPGVWTANNGYIQLAFYFLPLLDAAPIPTFVVFGMGVHTAVIRSVDYRSETSIQMVLISVY